MRSDVLYRWADACRSPNSIIHDCRGLYSGPSKCVLARVLSGAYDSNQSFRCRVCQDGIDDLHVTSPLLTSLLRSFWHSLHIVPRVCTRGYQPRLRCSQSQSCLPYKVKAHCTSHHSASHDSISKPMLGNSGYAFCSRHSWRSILTTTAIA